tara:strand:- start:116 stop:664 length:549 start_codon:yes stop_codon:yes gene_type:complete
MESSKKRNNRNNFEIGNLDRKVDQFLEAGRQFVDGVSGTRPGSRRRGGFDRISRANVKDVGRWVSDKVDSIFDDDEFEDWDDDNTEQFKYFSRAKDTELKKENSMYKRPLQARSLRELNKPIADESSKLLSAGNDWPEESDFKVNKWHRSNNQSEEINLEKTTKLSRIPKTKSFPKSRRRRI